MQGEKKQGGAAENKMELVEDLFRASSQVPHWRHVSHFRKASCLHTGGRFSLWHRCHGNDLLACATVSSLPRLYYKVSTWDSRPQIYICKTITYKLTWRPASELYLLSSQHLYSSCLKVASEVTVRPAQASRIRERYPFPDIVTWGIKEEDEKECKFLWQWVQFTHSLPCY